MNCLDTTYFIDLIRQPGLVKGITAEIEREGIVYTTVISVHEVMLGTYCVSDAMKRERLTDKLAKAFVRVHVLDVTRQDAVKSAEIAGTLLRKGIAVGNDAIIAAMALNHGLRVVTRNKKHFEPMTDVFGLPVLYY